MTEYNDPNNGLEWVRRAYLLVLARERDEAEARAIQAEAVTAAALELLDTYADHFPMWWLAVLAEKGLRETQPETLLAIFTAFGPVALKVWQDDPKFYEAPVRGLTWADRDAPVPSWMAWVSAPWEKKEEGNDDRQALEES